VPRSIRVAGVTVDVRDQCEVSHSLPDVPENEGPTPVASSWLGGAYVPPDEVATGPIPTITDDLTAEDVARLSQVESLMSATALPTVEPAASGEAAETAVHEAIRLSADADADVPTAMGLAAGEDADVETAPAVGDDAVAGGGDDDPGAVTTMFAVVTEERLEDAETTSFAAVPPVTRDRVAAPAEEATETGTPPRRGQRSRAVLIALAGALIVVVLGVAAAAAFGGERGKGPRPVPVPSAAALVPSAPGGTAGKAFPRYSGKKSPVLGRITDRAAGLSYSRLGGKWGYGQDGRRLSALLGVGRKGSQLRGIMQAGGAEYLSAPLQASLGRSATAAAAQAVARDIIRAGQLREPVVLPYVVERLSGGIRGWLAGFQVQSGPTDGEIVAVAVVDTGAARPGILCVTVPRGDKSVRPDIRAIVLSLRVAR
jgi:hypothetical protein